MAEPEARRFVDVQGACPPMPEKKPWLKYYGDIPPKLEYPRISLYEALTHSVTRHFDQIAWDFFGKTQTYAEFSDAIQRCADGLAALGLEAGDRMTIAMPTCPQGIIAFYAINCLGAVANIINPSATAHELQYYLNLSQSRFAITLDAHYLKFHAVKKQTPLKKLIVARISDYLPFSRKITYALTKERRLKSAPTENWVIKWSNLFDPNHPKCVPVPTNPDALAAILYSGGATSTPKGIMLSNHNLIASGMMVTTWGKLCRGDTILTILPLFHGFGLGVCINAAFMSGAKSLLMPQFTAKRVNHLIRTKHPNLIIGLPSLFHVLTQMPKFRKTDLRCLKAVFCGADILPRVVKERFEKIVHNSGGTVKIQEGYGLTEAVTAVMGNPAKGYREGSIGMPFPNMEAKIVRPDTEEELPCGQQGELCLHGPTVMLGYLNDPKGTNRVLKTHSDGKRWLHTEDICSMDNDGYFYFHIRLKRVINSSGITVSPVQVEDRLMRHPDVLETCVIGVPDLSLIEKVKAFVVLKETHKAGSNMVQILTDYCSQELAKESCPQEIEFRPEIPKTLLGKIAYHELWKQEIQKLQKSGHYAGTPGNWIN